MLSLLWHLFNLVCLIVVSILGIYCTFIGMDSLLHSTQYDKAIAYLLGAVLMILTIKSSRSINESSSTVEVRGQQED
jgi:peptidoglycan/LPS O-acetylase OafA/YrhL